MEKTPTDILKKAIQMSGGDMSLKIPCKFKKFTRPERRELLEELNSVAELREMKKHEGMWLRLGEILHPREYKRRYSHAHAAFHILRNTKVKSWEGKLAEEFKKGLTYGLNILLEKPDEFCKRLDELLRAPERGIVEIAEIINKLKIVAARGSNEAIFKLHRHFIKRGSLITRKWGKSLQPMSSSIVLLLTSTLEDTLEYKFSRLDPLGKVWIDPLLNKIPLPGYQNAHDFSIGQLLFLHTKRRGELVNKKEDAHVSFSNAFATNQTLVETYMGI